MTKNYLRNIFREAVSGRSCTSSSIANTTLTNVSENRGKRVKYGQSVKLSISESPSICEAQTGLLCENTFDMWRTNTLCK